MPTPEPLENDYRLTEFTNEVQNIENNIASSLGVPENLLTAEPTTVTLYTSTGPVQLSGNPIFINNFITETSSAWSTPVITTGDLSWNTGRTALEGYVGQPLTIQTVESMRSTWTQVTGDYTSTWNISDNSVSINTNKNYGYNFNPLQDIKEIIRNKIKSNLLIKSGIKNRYLINKFSPQEIKARETLRDMISERDWRRYVTNGFLIVKGNLGHWYQIFNTCNERIRVYNKGKLFAKICIHTDEKCPPTDHILNMWTLIKLDENSLWGKLGNIYYEKETSSNGHPSFGVGIDFTSKVIKESSLIELFKNNKNAKLTPPQVYLSGYYSYDEIVNPEIAAVG